MGLHSVHSRDLHLVLAPAKDAKPVRFVVTLDGVAPGENCGVGLGVLDHFRQERHPPRPAARRGVSP
jgi:hypothetical protein